MKMKIDCTPAQFFGENQYMFCDVVGCSNEKGPQKTFIDIGIGHIE